MSAQELIEAAASVLGDRAARNAPLGARTTYRVGGPAALWMEARGETDLALAAQAAAAAPGLPILVVGRGSNLLVADAGFPGLAITLGPGFGSLELPAAGPSTGRSDDPLGARVVVKAGGAASLPVLARRAAGAGLRGLEWAVGVPGSVGGAVRMNAGGHGCDLAASLVRARVADLARGGAPEWVEAGRLALGYRQSSLEAHQVVVGAELATTRGDRAMAEAEIAGIVRWRRDNQPGGPNAGSVFSNPAGDAAGRLIEAAGLKGRRLGSAEVSTKHANFIQADDGGSADDVRGLVTAVQHQVEATFGVRLNPEVRFVGFAPDLTLNWRSS